MPWLRTVSTAALLAPLATVALPAGLYTLTLTALAARQPRGHVGPSGRPARKFAVLVPAHDEEAVIARALRSLNALDYPRELCDVWLVADNCADNTAALARAQGAIVRERHNQELIGKGYALDWLLREIAAAGETYDAFIVVDADSELSAGFLRAMDAALAAGAQVAQGYYTVLPLHGNRGEALRSAALALVHYVRPLAKERFGGSCGLKGNGMCFAAPLLERFGWPTAGLAEDVEFHLQLVEQGHRVAFVPEAVVRGEMPATLAAARTQHERWEAGRLATIRRRALPLLARGLRQRRLTTVDAAVEQLMPPLSVPVCVALVCGCAGALLHEPLVWATASVSLGALAIYVCGGLLVAGASRAEWQALASAPLYIAWKAALYARALRPAQRGWQRTARTQTTPETTPQ